MTWSYASSNITSSGKSQVRFLCGQNSSVDDVLLADAEVTWAITQAGGVYFAAALCCETLGSRYATKATQRSVGQLGLGYLDRAKQLREQAMTLRRLGMTRGVQVFSGGQAVADKDSLTTDSSLVQPQFKLGMDDNPSLSSSTTT